MTPFNKITDDQRNRIRSETDFYELVSTVTELTQAGPTAYRGRCPFHDDSTPSFTIDTEAKVFNCFGCAEGGDLFKFVMLTQNCSFREAVEILDRDAPRLTKPTQVRKSAPPKPKELSNDPELLRLLLAAQVDFHKRLLSSDGARTREYLAQRGITTDQIERYGIGLTPSKAYELTSRALKRGITPESMHRAGLTTPGRTGGQYRDYFTDSRITFPIHDDAGRIRGFAARLTPFSRQSANPDRAKYVNSRNSSVFHKGHLVFALPQAIKDLADETVPRALIVTEGYLDAIAIAGSGAATSISTMGTAVTALQAELLTKLDVPLYLAFDGDAPGRAAAAKLKELLAKQSPRMIRTVELPEESDPASFIHERGIEEFRALLNNAS